MKKILLSLILISTISVQAESLFSLNATQNAMIEPKALFSSVRARSVGDLVSIVVEETVSYSDDGEFTTSKSNSLAKNLTKAFKIISKSKLAEVVDTATDDVLDVTNTTNTTREIQLKDTIVAQVVQVLPNGNLLVQGKKSLVEQNERLDIIISGIVEPKWINQAGEINSSYVANLQFAVTGAGSVSRGQNEGIINKAVRMVF